ncbi:alanine racemase [Microbacteriaceae bacterium SG_E_30_P1]|uniref:Alanine racemase n=2 Tax=Antiquaquibacter oligotrophicus TaxID=2880260 RepID=A0ABT6KMT0_9MICO|nr:alanine racemase C-terminal domain-containing protein [Antiquaquibacter oligotrophicus]MDH6181045.1 alanine racemase [Antiquaquibacter oligotrophicus]
MSQGTVASGVRRVARIDLEALRANLAALVAEDSSVVLDARADAYGHGLTHVAQAAVDAGIGTIRIGLRDTPPRGIRRSMLMTVPSVRPTAADAAYGFDGVAKPVMTLVGEVIAVKPTEEGAGVSYGYTYRTEEPTTLALVGLGYADGIPRLASNRATVAIGGRFAPIVGRIAMDQFVVDCGSARVSVGDDVTLWGDPGFGHPTATDWGVVTERRALDLTAGLGSRITRVHS